MSKFLVFSDLHLYPHPQFAGYDGGVNSRLIEIGDRLYLVLLKAFNENCDGIFFPGDFFHDRRKIDIVSLATAHRIFKEARRVPLYGCSGTHDLTYTGHSSLEVFASEQERFFVDTNEVILLDTGEQCGIVCVPHLSDYNEQNARCRAGALDFSQQSIERRILITHGDYIGSESNGIRSSTGVDLAVLKDMYDLILLGHIHNPSTRPYENVLIPGHVIPNGFGDVGPGKCHTIEYLGNGEWRGVTHVFGHPQFVTHTVMFSDGVYNWLGGDLQDYHRIVVPSGVQVQIPPSDPPYNVRIHHIAGVSADSTVREVLGAEALTREGLVDRYFQENFHLFPVIFHSQLLEIGKALVRDPYELGMMNMMLDQMIVGRGLVHATSLP